MATLKGNLLKPISFSWHFIASFLPLIELLDNLIKKLLLSLELPIAFHISDSWLRASTFTPQDPQLVVLLQAIVTVKSALADFSKSTQSMLQSLQQHVDAWAGRFTELTAPTGAFGYLHIEVENNSRLASSKLGLCSAMIALSPTQSLQDAYQEYHLPMVLPV